MAEQRTVMAESWHLDSQVGGTRKDTGNDARIDSGNDARKDTGNDASLLKPQSPPRDTPPPIRPHLLVAQKGFYNWRPSIQTHLEAVLP